MDSSRLIMKLEIWGRWLEAQDIPIVLPLTATKVKSPSLGKAVTIYLALSPLLDPIHSVKVPAESESKLYSTL